MARSKTVFKICTITRLEASWYCRFCIIVQCNVPKCINKLNFKIGGGELAFKSCPMKVYDFMSMVYGNISIMYKLLKTLAPNLEKNGIPCRIENQLMRWSLVMTWFLSYYREYRCLHQHKFCWGTNIPHLQTVFLSCRFQQNNNTVSGDMNSWLNGQPKHIVYASHSSGGKEMRLSSRRVCYSPNCKFEHIHGCGQTHSTEATLFHSNTKKLYCKASTWPQFGC